MSKILVKKILILFMAIFFSQNALLRGEEVIRIDIRLMGTDLVDELIYDWLSIPPFSQPQKLVLGDFSAPLGLDDRFQLMIENRLYELFSQNPRLSLSLIRCTACNRLVTKSSPAGTYFGRGIDQPEILRDLINREKDALGLGLYFEAEGKELVLRAQVFELLGAQKIVWAKTYSTSMSSRRVLRQAHALTSWTAAKEEQEAIIKGKDQLEFSARALVRTFNQSSRAIIAAPAIPFVEASLEGFPRAKKDVRLGITAGFSSVANSLAAWSVGGHWAHLLFRSRPSLINPDLYLFFGTHYLRLSGPDAAPFAINQPSIFNIQGIKKEPRASITAWRLGLEGHIKFKLGMMAFLEYIPALKDNNVFNEETALGIPYHSWGWGMVYRW